MTTCVATSIDVALLGCGNVGSAFARLAAREATPTTPLRITGAFVRDPSRPRDLPGSLPLSSDAATLLAHSPDVVVELLGGVEPARTLLVQALLRGIPVVTANKSLLARHGCELRRAAAERGTPLLYEAAVLAGVPFLGTFARRANAASATSIVGIANGTCNYILTRCATDGCDIAQALSDAQRLGYAEPDPFNDLSGTDAAEKVAVLLQHFAAREVSPDAIQTTGIDTITRVQLDHARELDGVIKPVVYADWTHGIEAFVGPAFVPSRHVLARVDGADNALLFEGGLGRLLFQGPGAGPDVTAATVLDDVREIARGAIPPPDADVTPGRAIEPETGWMITLEAARLPRTSDVADLLASHALYLQRAASRRTDGGREFQSLLLWPAERLRVEHAARALRQAADCATRTLRTLEIAA